MTENILILALKVKWVNAIQLGQCMTCNHIKNITQKSPELVSDLLVQAVLFVVV